MLRFSDSARAMRTHEETIAALRAELATAKTETAAAVAKVAELEAAARPASREFLTIR